MCAIKKIIIFILFVHLSDFVLSSRLVIQSCNTIVYLVFPIQCSLRLSLCLFPEFSIAFVQLTFYPDHKTIEIFVELLYIGPPAVLQQICVHLSQVCKETKNFRISSFLFFLILQFPAIYLLPSRFIMRSFLKLLEGAFGIRFVCFFRCYHARSFPNWSSIQAMIPRKENRYPLKVGFELIIRY